MKKPLKIALALVLLLVIAAVALPFLIPAEKYKEEITRRVTEATGREFMIHGPMRLTLFPDIGVKFAQATLANPKGYSGAQMMEVESAEVQVALLPLLSGDVQVKRFVLQKPVISLEVNAAGVPNWQFTPKEAAEMPPQMYSESFALIAAAHAAEKSPAPAISAMQRVQLGEVKIESGTLHYRDRPQKKDYTLQTLNLTLAMPHTSAPLELQGDAEFNGEKVALTARLENPQAFLDGKASALKAALESKPVTLNFNGDATQASANGDAVLAVPSLPKLAAWAGGAFEWQGKTPLALNAKGQLAWKDKQCTLKKASLALDEMAFNGELGISWAGRVPMLAADLAADALDLNPYLLAAHADAPPAFALVSSAQAAEGWSSEPMNFSALRALNADVDLRAKSVLAKAVTMSDIQLSGALKDGALQVNLPSFSLYGGKGNANAAVDAAGSIRKQVNLTGVQAQPFLTDAAQFERLSGAMDIALNVSGRGASQQQIVSSLSGNGSVRFTDGAFTGVNLAQLVRDFKSAVTLQPGGSAQKTDFAELGGTFAIAQGIAHTNDLAMKAPLLRLKGEGDVDLPRQHVQMRVTPELVASLKGQGGKEKEGLAVPVIIEGPFDRLTFRPDLEAAARDALKDPEKLKETVSSVKEQIKSGGLKENLKDLKKNPDAVKDLLKGFGR